MNAGFLVLVLLVAVAVIAVVVFQRWLNQKRVQQLVQFCRSKGWRFVVRDDEYAVRWRCPPFFEGRNRQVRDVISGAVGSAAQPFVAFDYSYVTDSNNGRNRSSTTHRYAICALTVPAYFPALELTPETVLTRLGNVVTGEDIDLESETFNRRFHVECPDPKFASDVLPPRTMQDLLGRRPLHLRFEGSELLCWETGVTTPVELLERLAALTAFVDGIPAFVWHDYGVNAGTDPPPGAAQ
jgi:hypothetical protein